MLGEQSLEVCSVPSFFCFPELNPVRFLYRLFTECISWFLRFSISPKCLLSTPVRLFLLSPCGRAGSAHFMDQLFWTVREKYLLSFGKLCWSGKGLLHRDNPSNPCYMTCFTLCSFFPFFSLPKYYLFRSVITSQIPSLFCSLLFYCPWACWLHTLLQIFWYDCPGNFPFGNQPCKTSNYFFLSSNPLFMSAIFLMALHIPLSHLYTLSCLVACAASWNSTDCCLF